MSDTPIEPTASTPSVPAQPLPADPPAAPPGASPPQGKPERKRPGGPGGPGGGAGGMPRRRMREAIPSLDDDYRFGANPNLKNLDAEIEDELAAALGGVDAKTMFASDTSREVQQQAAAGTGGNRKVGKVLSVHSPDVFVSIPGGRSEGVLPLEQFPDGPPRVGSEVEVSIEGYDPANGLLVLTRLGAAVQADWSTVAEGQIVEARVLETNKGGLTVDVNGIRGFMPISQIDLYRVENAESYVNQKLMCMVTSAEPEERNLVLSRRALLEKQRDEMREKLWEELAEGQVRDGVVRSIREFGAFVDIGGADGLLPVSEMTWRRNVEASTLVQPGQAVKVSIIRLDRERRKITLSLKQLEESPWMTIRARVPVGEVIEGKVTRLAEFGAFVEVEPGIEGLVHISELAKQRVWRVKDIVKEGDAVKVKVLDIDEENRRISLSIRQAIAEPVTVVAEEEDDEVVEPVKPRPRNPNLRGGIGGDQTYIPESEE